MKSGKSLELIARVAPYKVANKTVLLVQSSKNTRETTIMSRSGLSVAALCVGSLSEVHDPFDVIGIDEIHMFDAADAAVIEQWLADGKVVIISGLDLDYRGKLVPIVQKLLELQPEERVSKQAVCEVCHNFTAQYSQILQNKKPIVEGLPLVTPEDGTYTYEARCRKCMVRSS